MHKQLHDAFDNIHTSRQLKADTLASVMSQKPVVVKKQPPLALRFAAACLPFVLIASACTALYFIPVTAIRIDTDPASAQLKINCFDRVVGVDGDADNTDVKHMKYTDALSCMLDENEHEDTVITVVGNERILSDLEENVQHHKNVHCGYLSNQAAQQADSCGMSAAKYELYLILVQNGVDITPQQAQQLPMRELRALCSEDNTATQTTAPDEAVSEPDTTECESSQQHQNGKHHGKNHD